ncbi:MAG: hypothetical protein H6720_10920 [Sandaracinus sp.]|nr:hypothetical protein [Sandaracinus sp.]
MAEDLGARLVRAGLATREQLAIALAEGAQSGGALAAGLVDAGVSEEDIVSLFVSEGVGPEARELVPLSPPKLSPVLATAFLALPISESDQTVEVAMADPTDTHALGELRAALAREVKPRPARVSVLRRALARAFPHTPTRPPAPTPLELVRRKPIQANPGDVPLPLARPKTLPTGVVQQSFPRPKEPEVAVRSTVRGTADYAAPRPTEPPPSRRASDPGEAARVSSSPPRSILSDHEASWSDLVAPDPKATTSSANQRALPEIGGTLAALRASRDRDAIVRLACEAASSVARTTVFLALRKGVLRGWEGVGQVSADALRNLWIPASSPSVFQKVLERGEPHRGPHGTTAADKLFRAATGSRGGTLVVEPIRVGDRIVAVLCADDPRHGQAGLERLETLAHAVGAALERLIVETKR